MVHQHSFLPLLLLLDVISLYGACVCQCNPVHVYLEVSSIVFDEAYSQQSGLRIAACVCVCVVFEKRATQGLRRPSASLVETTAPEHIDTPLKATVLLHACTAAIKCPVPHKEHLAALRTVGSALAVLSR